MRLAQSTLDSRPADGAPPILVLTTNALIRMVPAALALFILKLLLMLLVKIHVPQLIALNIKLREPMESVRHALLTRHQIRHPAKCIAKHLYAVMLNYH